MPEGPSLILVREDLEVFSNKKITRASGNARVDMSLLANKTIGHFKTWGKQLFIFIKKGPVIRIHFLMFGSYSLDEQRKPESRVRLCLHMAKRKIYFYTCSVKFVEDPTDHYDWEADVMNDHFDVAAARKKLKALPGTLVCDALLNQDIFSGVGNIMKNEILYRIRVHPESTLGSLPPSLTTKLIKEARNYAFDFLTWKRNFELKKHWLAHTKKLCKRCELPIVKIYAGRTKRRSFFCPNCQVKYE